jgi:hypothetical protein
MRWPRLAEYLAENPDDAVLIGGNGDLPADLPKDLGPLLADVEVEQVVFGRAEGVEARLDPSSIRASVSA